MLRLIVNADDFGLSHKVNEGIREAHDKGILTSASIMANGAAFDGAIEICRQYPSIDVGIHLTLVEEQPVLSKDQVSSLVDGEGKMYGHATKFMKKYLIGRINLQEVREELKAQIKKVVNAGIKISHIDSHQHLHMLPKILPIVVGLAKDFNIPAIRFPKERFRFNMLKEKYSLGRILQMSVLNSFCAIGQRTIPLRTDYFYGFLFGGNLNIRNMQKTLQSLPSEGVCELMCHPGFNDPDSNYKHWEYHSEDELKALTGPEIRDCIERKKIKLISYGQFADTFRHTAII